MLAAHISDVNQLVYDQSSDFAVSQDSNGVNVISPRNADTHDAFVILQHAINRIAPTLGLSKLAENGVLNQALFLNVFQIANSDQMVSQAQSFIDGLKRNGTFNSLIQLGPFRSKFPPGPDLTNFMNTTLLDLGRRARLWGSLFSALADTIWWSTAPNTATPVVPTTSRLPLVLAAIAGLAVGTGATIFIFMRRRR